MYWGIHNIILYDSYLEQSGKILTATFPAVCYNNCLRVSITFLDSVVERKLTSRVLKTIVISESAAWRLSISVMTPHFFQCAALLNATIERAQRASEHGLVRSDRLNFQIVRMPIRIRQYNSGIGDAIGSFRSGNADVRLCVSCANFGSWHSYELESLRTLRMHYGNRQKIRFVLEVRRNWRSSQSETFPGEGIRSCITCTQTIHGWAASLIRESACKAQRHNRRKQYRQGWLLRASHSSLRRPGKAPYWLVSVPQTHLSRMWVFKTYVTSCWRAINLILIMSRSHVCVTPSCKN